LTEKELIIRLKQGDEPAFRWLVEQHRNRVYYSVLNLLQDPDEAEDATQETFIQVYESIYSFKEESLLSTWIYRIAIRKALERIRRKKTRQRLHAVLPWWMPDEKKSEEARYLNPGIKAEDKEKANALFMAIEALPDKQKIAFTLVKVQGMSYDEVCGIMGLGVKAVESLISRAKENLKKKLDQHYKSYN
jgi:RNA polymerase sigma factor (sigma-70 family)